MEEYLLADGTARAKPTAGESVGCKGWKLQNKGIYGVEICKIREFIMQYFAK